MKISRVLIIQTAFLGDVILTTPLIDALANAFHGIQIDFLTIPASVNLIETHPALEKVYAYDKRGQDAGLHGLHHFSRAIKQQKYDVCICPHRSVRSAYLTYQTRADIRIGFNTSGWRGGFTDLVRYKQDIHEIARNLSLLHPLKIFTPLKKPTIFTDENDRSIVDHELKKITAKEQKQLFAVAPGSVWPTKRWPKSSFTAFCVKLHENNWQTVLIGSNNDIALCAEIAQASGKGINLAGKFTLRQTGHLLSKCQALLTNDSAPLHLGMAFDIPVFALFGPTLPEFGFGPFGSKGFILERKDVGCRPCGIHGGKKCPVKTFACMELITAEDVLKKVHSYFANQT